MKLKDWDYLDSTRPEDRRFVLDAAEHVGIRTEPNSDSESYWYCVMMNGIVYGLYAEEYRRGRALNAYQFTLDLFETAGKTEVEAIQYIFGKNYAIKTDDTMKTGLQEKDAVIADIDTIRGIYKLAREIGVSVWSSGSIKAEDYLPGGERGGIGSHNIVWMRDNKGLVPFKSPTETDYKVIPAAEFIARMYVQAGKEQPPQDRASVLKDRINKLRTA